MDGLAAACSCTVDIRPIRGSGDRQGGIVISNQPRRARPLLKPSQNHLKPSQTISNHLKPSQSAPPTFGAPPVCRGHLKLPTAHLRAPPVCLKMAKICAPLECARPCISNDPSQKRPAPPLSTYYHLNYLKLATLLTPYATIPP